MIEIDLLNGQILSNLKSLEVNSKQLVSTNKLGDKYYSTTKTNLEFDKYIFTITENYKNSQLTSLTIFIDSKWIKNNYYNNDIDYKDYISQYVDFCKEHTNRLLDLLLKTNKRKFDWGKIQVLIDPRDPTIFAEIKYYNKVV